MAFKIESELDKDTIFELYVNSIFFGNGYYCVADASNGYFGKVPSEMNFDECTFLPECRMLRQTIILQPVPNLHGRDRNRSSRK